MTLDELRHRRHELQDADDAISYVRRVAQGRADLARAELERRLGGAAVEDRQAEVRDVLADRLLGAPGRPPRPVDDWSDHPRAIELDRLCAEHGYGRLLDLDADELAEFVRVLDEFETAVSAERQAVYRQLDEVTDQFIAAYRQEAPQG